ncbi:uncharacterized protein ARMOST_18794 [Armillaria ostoyae]|uniref:Uncharacterized protein n=1 Tax=Armillaria ostoyae TaxID=47428 RepID=A0A284S2Q7_ARMOS|nr:uncharacterized protein ARMOST_18794 [Armillaria ostoyae]
MTNKSSDIVFLSDRTVTYFGENYDVKDPVAELEYYDQLVGFRRVWHCDRSLSVGESFDVTLPTLAKPEGGHELPPFSHNGGDYMLVVTKVLQHFLKSEAHWSLVCTADVRTQASDKTCGTVVLKIFQILPLPVISRAPFSVALASKKLAGCEDYAYSELKDLQGTALLYYYGKHKFCLACDALAIYSQPSLIP